MVKKGLGKGLEALFQNEAGNDGQGMSTHISVFEIDSNPAQPRKHFQMDKLDELAASIREHGVLQPVLVVKKQDRYMLVAGERRLRAARIVGLDKVPAIIRELDEREIAEIALIENLQRDDLNPLEEAEGIQLLMEQFQSTQEEVAKRLGRSRSAVANSLRLLTLPAEVRQLLRENKISAGHARCLAGLGDASRQRELAMRVVKQGLSVREIEQLSREQKQTTKPEAKQATAQRYPEFEGLEGMLRAAFGTRAQVLGDMSRGKIVLEYFNREDLERIYEVAEAIGNSMREPL